MKFLKTLAIGATVALTGSVAFANDINFKQSAGSITNLTFTQSGTGNLISEAGVSAAAPATVTGSLDTLNIVQGGSSNTASLDITGTGVGDKVSIDMQGSDNILTAKVANTASQIDIESSASNLTLDLEQTGLEGGQNNKHTILANISKTGTDVATVTLKQLGETNTIKLGDRTGAQDAFEGGLTLEGGTGDGGVSITQYGNATYEASHTVTAGGTVTVTQGEAPAI
ncbi:hypothetical protein [Pontibaca salina]|uniref:Curlin associated repeat-containing protein n=1 Tax=Pontibaca salina TaxID=2795731 RepID=A0A934HS32_9RHOB|nr:hypothetical protein [Pontibaca salina]MBI6629183.1 hypothetical protein [Pontibaca salina]